MYCPDKELKSWKELSTAVGDDVALLLWNRNRGRGLDLTPNGVPSKLFNDLLNMTDGNRIEAFKLKAGFYTDNFIKTNNWIETGAEPSINNLISSTSNVIGIEISSNSKGIGAALTNPTELARKKGNIVDSYPVEYNGVVYEDSEEAYKDLKDESETKTKPTIENSKNYALMVNIIKAKLEQHPRLVAKVKSLGGSNWILASTHQPTSKNSVWETNGKNWFIKALNEAYKTVSGITKLKMSDFINHSGGAYGADTYWDLIGRTFGVIQHVHYKTLDLPKVSKQLRQKGVISKVLTNTQLEESYDQLEKTFNREFERTDNNDLKARNYYQVKNASSIFAVAFLDGSKAVKGGTNAAVQMAIGLNKPVYVYDVASESWYKWDGTKFITTTTPILTKNFAGIGTRDVEDYEVFDEKTDKYVKRKGYVGIEKENAIKNAIKEVYQNTQNNLNNIENIGVLEKIAKSEPTTSVKPNVKDLSRWSDISGATNPYTNEGIVVTRVGNIEEQFGNPFIGSKRRDKQGNLVESKVDNITVFNTIDEADQAYRDWLMGTKHQNIKPLRREWILDQINEGKLDGKTLLYYKPMEVTNNDGTIVKGGYHSHADTLAEIVEELRSKPTQPSTSVEEQIQDRQIKVDQFNLLVKSDGTMFYDNGKEVTNQTIKNKANIRKELQDGTLKVSTYNNSNYFVLSDNRVVSSGKTTLGKESVTDPKIKEMILDKAVKYKKDC